MVQDVFYFRNGRLGTGDLESTGKPGGFQLADFEPVDFSPLLHGRGPLWRAPEFRSVVLTARSSAESSKESLKLIASIVTESRNISVDEAVTDFTFSLWSRRFLREFREHFPKGEETIITQENLPASLEFEIVVSVTTEEIQLNGTSGFVSLDVTPFILGLSEEGWRDLQTHLFREFGFRRIPTQQLLTV